MAGTNAAVVVAFNRKQLLTECLNGLLRQTLSLDAVFVIDNASTDGTELWLREHGYLDHPKIRYIRLPENGGGAGGFYQGVRAAFQAGFEWIWLMDDDTEPEPDALGRMTPLKTYPKVVAIANEKVDIHGKETLDGLRLMPGQRSGSGTYRCVKFSSFVGLLIRATAIEKIGFPRPEFFIHNDDLEYCLRLRKVGEIALANGSRVVHKEQARQSMPRKLLGFTYLPRTLHEFCLEYFGHRNYVVTQRAHGNAVNRFLLPLRRLVLAAGTVVLFGRNDRLQRFRVLLRAFLDGYRGNFDNGYPFRLREQLRASEKSARPSGV